MIFSRKFFSVKRLRKLKITLLQSFQHLWHSRLMCMYIQNISLWVQEKTHVLAPDEVIFSTFLRSANNRKVFQTQIFSKNFFFPKPYIKVDINHTLCVCVCLCGAGKKRKKIIHPSKINHWLESFCASFFVCAACCLQLLAHTKFLA